MNKSLSEQETKKYSLIIWKILITGIALFAIFISMIGLGLFGELPSFRDIEHPKSNQASEIIAEDGRPLGTYFVQNRSNVTYKDISENVINGLIATEDTRFKEHSGIDFKRTFTIIGYNLIGKKQGASTITQQLAKNLFPRESNLNFFSLVLTKFKEWIVAVKLERNYTKEEIITMYLNTVDFGNQAYGIKSAARVYFNTTPDKLTLTQAATLVGMQKGITMYSPTRHPERSRDRRNTVMAMMVKSELLSQQEFEEQKDKPLGLKFNAATVNDGIAPYFRSVLKNDIKNIFQEQGITKPDGSAYDLDRDGLKIYTTINYDMQKYAEEAQKEYMKVLQAQFLASWRGRNPFKGKDLQIQQGIKRSDRYKSLKLEGKSEEEIKDDFNTKTEMTIFTWKGNVDTVMKPIDSVRYYKMLLRNAMMTMDPTNGHVKAWVGGINYEHFKYDQVKMGTRQVGSTAKPFTYAVAIENGYSPCFTVANVPVTIDGYGEPWTPKSSGKPLAGSITLQKALAFSQNYVTAYLMKQVGPVAVSTLATKMGIPNVPAYPSIALGTFDSSIYNMVGAYGAFANKGVYTKPIYLLKIEDKNGVVLFSQKEIPKPIMSEEVAYVMTRMLKGVVSGGTGSRLNYKYKVNAPIGGKTGTTQNNSDGWFMAITPQLVTGVWTGCEDRAFHFISTSQGEGANTALPIFAGFIKRVYANPSLKISHADFDVPKSGVSITYDCNQYQQQQEETNPELDEKLGF
ncbi:penicillin-binding protein 1A [Pedobacter psychrotolerans]|uniref:Penicillin-binding protein 1A n=1 Tax=Pedobacter psychrotolerans TaxID=1843235 RepID=A0A4R2H9L5_9SPHI|nr:transglycosylase domain-containing protein [Pedobacter psychrotolerans]TCO23769.1 penicillin-binding protein 1A [Pedobacter psychrotolerans]GGE62462.1 penicillin-binding protein 1A [Pedobacter psychrotolerans]